MGLEERKKGSAPKKITNLQEELDEALLRFQASFELLQKNDDPKMRKYYFDSLIEELNQLDVIAKGIDRKGIRKQESILSKDAKKYFSSQSQENFEKLRQDIATLKEANRVPKNISR